ncbi:hypothetical protein [Methylobacterium organophilum]|uniref:Transmembrane protein n=1 Tax=Methylobacterium organophilum TaxID=410 RepID=A0ABQ4TCD7_METOR|nr:hypothetical protein [Methylobacterium organophilum]GJE29337.1 hypothetical protein LKMONMHP_4217 [Methylobacterium organophilum]
MASGADPKQPHYNPIFDRLAPAPNAKENIRGLLAYGLYKVAKREWAQAIWEKEQRKPTQAELDAYATTWTDSLLEGLQERADSSLAVFGNVAVAEATPAIREEALRGTTAKAIGTSVIANAVYTILLIAFAVILYLAGIDIVGFVQKFRPPNG